MCYSHFHYEVCNGVISITQWFFINDCYMVKPIGQWGKIVVMAMDLQITWGQNMMRHITLILVPAKIMVRKISISLVNSTKANSSNYGSITGKVGRFFIAQNNNCLLGYPVVCLQANSPNKLVVWSFWGQSTVPPLCFSVKKTMLADNL